jgi:hypothetical protein
MSHFSVVVALPAETEDVGSALAALLDPFDENKEVESYEEDGETYWRNPQAKWDYWLIGGRWRGYFPIADGAAPPTVVNEAESVDGAPELIAAEYRGHFPEFHDLPTAGYCDGGRIRALDLKRKRDEAGDKAEKDWNEYAAAIHGTPQHTPWSEFRARVELSEQSAPKPWKQLVEEAYDRGRVAAGLASEDTFDHLTRDEYVQQQRDRAVPGYATVRADGRWMAPGRMGWFGMSDDDPDSYAYYVREANKYLDSLPQDAFLVALDCHI